MKKTIRKNRSSEVVKFSKNLSSQLTVHSSLGFTLAEVLITLGIIGVVAAMTIPILIANNQKAQYVTALQKGYTEFNQALIQISTDYGCTGDLQCTGLFANGTTNDTLGQALVRYFNVTKNCGTINQNTSGQNSCMSMFASNNFDGTSARYGIDVNYRFIIADGMSFRILNYGTNCSLDAAIGSTGSLTQACGYIQMDVNGPLKGPNNFGRDIFVFYITNGKGPLLYPQGGQDYISPWKTNACIPSNTWGAPCSGRIMDESWQMNY